MKLYKLTTWEHTTYHGSMHWEVGKTNRVEKCKNPELGTEQVIHAYKNKNLALLLHANIDDPVLWECEGKIVVEDFGKVGVFALKATKIIRLPQWYLKRRKDVAVMFAILCAESVLDVYETNHPNDKRPREAIDAAKEYLKTKTKNTAYAVSAAADDASAAANSAYAASAAVDAIDDASAAANSARAAANAARAVARAAYSAARATYATAYARDAAAYAADVARATANNVDFCILADKAVRIMRMS